jgi:hypothetical protein
MCRESFEMCSCDCHRHPDFVKHCAPCCYTCPHCGQNVKFLYKDQHVERCKEICGDFDVNNLAIRKIIDIWLNSK